MYSRAEQYRRRGTEAQQRAAQTTVKTLREVGSRLPNRRFGWTGSATATASRTTRRTRPPHLAASGLSVSPNVRSCGPWPAVLELNTHAVIQDSSAKQRNSNPMSVPGLFDEARQAVNAAFDAMSVWRIRIDGANMREPPRH
jgi:hypothetical protein